MPESVQDQRLQRSWDQRHADPAECPGTTGLIWIQAPRDNPKREGTASHARWKKFAGAATINKFRARGGNLSDLRDAISNGYVKLAGKARPWEPFVLNDPVGMAEDTELAWMALSNWNPKGEGTSSHKRWRQYFGSENIRDFYDSGGTLEDLRDGIRHGYVKPCGFAIGMPTISQATYTFKNPEDSRFAAFFRANGFVVLKDVLKKPTHTKLLSEFWKAWEHVNPACRRKQRDSWAFPLGYKSIQPHYGLAQSDFAWMVRQSPRVKQAFASLFKEQDLVVSMDAVILSDRNFQRASPSLKPWLHKDQKTSEEMLSIQGIYSAVSVSKNLAGTVLVPGSQSEPLRSERQLQLPDAEYRRFAHRVIKPELPADSLLLFDSKLIHANDPGTTSRNEKDSKGVLLPDRLAVAVAFAPAERRSENTLKKKQEAYFKQSTSNHWPCDRFSLKKRSFQDYVKGGRFLPVPKNCSKRLKLL
eukprot:TRINITY_DN16743_c1_g1_i1.p1 TRINITY_DN16743_c1_g1~~TRINITY_DN16743_c1_g1_i1.p1  ORF type:complete len:473 (+),score=75.02 TRINITY_DN16743_c1_g1_i1:47-1465(+)